MVIQFFCYYLLYQRNTRLVKTFILDQQQYFIFAYQSNRDWIRIENQRKGLQTAIMVDGEVVICLWSSGGNACGALEGLGAPCQGEILPRSWQPWTLFRDKPVLTQTSFFLHQEFRTRLGTLDSLGQKWAQSSNRDEALFQAQRSASYQTSPQQLSSETTGVWCLCFLKVIVLIIQCMIVYH